MNLCWYGTAAIMIEHEGTVLAFDPFCGMPLHEDARPAARAEAFARADAVLVTHGHFDHIYDIPRLYRNTGVPIYATVTPIATLADCGFDRSQLRLVAGGWTRQIGGFTIRVFASRHCVFDTRLILSKIPKCDTLLHLPTMLRLLLTNRAYPENGETVFYEVEAGGKRVQIMGSMGLRNDVAYPTGADVLILPFQGTSDPAAAVAPLIERLQPARILLDHYDDAFPPMSDEVATASFVVKTLGRGILCEALTEGKTYSV